MSDVASVAAGNLPSARTVLTSENSADFYAKKLNIVPEPAKVDPPAKAEGDAKAVESAERASANEAEKVAAEQQEADHPDPEKKHKLNVRFSELSKQRDEAKALAEKNAAEAKTQRDARELAERQAAELKAKYEPPKPDELGPKPTRAQFANDEEFLLAIEDYAGEKREREVRAEEAETRRVSVFKDRLKEFRAEAPDYDEALNNSTAAISNRATRLILESEAGPKILYHLAKNPEIATAWRGMSDDRVAVAIGKLEAKLEGAKASAEPAALKPAAAATEISRAPAPISPLKGSGSAVATATVDSDGEFHGTFADWKAQRKAGKIK